MGFIRFTNSGEQPTKAMCMEGQKWHEIRASSQHWMNGKLPVSQDEVLLREAVMVKVASLVLMPKFQS